VKKDASPFLSLSLGESASNGVIVNVIDLLLQAGGG